MEKKYSYTIIEEPANEVLEKLIVNSLNFCSFFQLVVQDFDYLNDNAQRLSRSLDPFLIESKSSNSWPGTELFYGHVATVNKYLFNQESSKILITAAPRLYSWIQPELPEDLCLLRQDGTPWLVTISHEKDSYFEITEEEKENLIKEIPLLKIKAG